MVELGKKVRKSRAAKETQYLPDEIITNLLIRLPVKSLVRFELVCRKWRDIIMDRDFIDLHQRTSLPVILVLPEIKNEYCFFGIDKWWDLSRTRSMIHRFPFRATDIPYAVINFSHAGLVVVEASPWSEAKISIVNPARPNECVEIFFSVKFWSSGCRIFAVYYHPILEEYCSLWKIHRLKSGRSKPTIQYRLLNLGSEPYFRRIRNPLRYRAKNEYASPLFINNHLYWMLECEEQEDRFGGRNDIMEFDVICEDFKVISCPVPLNTECKRSQTQLLNIDGVVSFVLFLPTTVTIWRLEDRVQRLWSSIVYTPTISEKYQDVSAYADIIAIVDGKLAFELGARFFVCDLVEGTVKNVPKRKWYNGNVLFWSHQMTLASLKKCKSPLYIDKYGMVSWSGKSTV